MDSFYLFVNILNMLAFSSKHPHVPNPKKSSRWIASLSDGSTVFEDVTPYTVSAWRRLKEYVFLHKLKITNLRLEGYGINVELVPYKDINGSPQIEGYWYSRKIGGWLNAGNVPEMNWSGIGVVKNGTIFVTWIDEQGRVTHEFKEYDPENQACIIC